MFSVDAPNTNDSGNSNQQEHHAHHSHSSHQQDRSRVGTIEALLSDKRVLACAFIVIFAIIIWLRLGLVQYQGLFEPDAFFYYTIIKATLAMHLHEPQHLALSGFAPNHSFIGEAPGLPYLTVILYLLVGWTGVGVLTVMRWLPVIFGLVEAILAYLIAKELTKSRTLGLLAMITVAMSSGNIARTAALVYRGDTFIGVPMMAAIYLLMRALREDTTKMQAVYGVAATFALSTGILVWNGSDYTVAVYLLALAMLTVYAFVQNNKELSKRILLLAGILFLLLPLQLSYIGLKGARPGFILDGISFLPFYIPVLAAAALSFLVLKKMMHGFMLGKVNRLILVIVFAVLVLGAMAITLKGYVSTLGTISGTVAASQTNQTQAQSNAIGTTTQELQKPSTLFIFASFNLQTMLAPIGLIMFLLIGDGISSDHDGGEKKQGLLSMNPAFIIMLSYLLITAYLQSNAIRWNSLISIPIAIFAAYAIYGLLTAARRRSQISTVRLAIVALVVLITAGYIGYAVGPFLLSLVQTGSIGYVMEGGFALASLVGVIAYVLLWFVFTAPRSTVLKYASIIVAALIILAGISAAAVQSYTSGQADGINPSFLSAMVWMRGNTPVNSTVLTLWPDGSVVEGWGNRTSYMDSVGGENGTRIYYFARFLMNDSPDVQYLDGIGRPEYLVARQYWMIELQGLIAEGIPSNPANYNYVAMQPTNIGHNTNNTVQYYSFANQNYRTILVINHTTNTTEANQIYSAYLQINSTYSARLSRIIFYNLSDNLYNTVNSTVPATNYTLMVFFQGDQISTALLMTNGLEQSNLFKFVYLCNRVSCAYNTTGARLNLIYVNNDTKIYRITYT